MTKDQIRNLVEAPITRLMQTPSLGPIDQMIRDQIIRAALADKPEWQAK
jgi:hypothetical protein